MSDNKNSNANGVAAMSVDPSAPASRKRKKDKRKDKADPSVAGGAAAAESDSDSDDSDDETSKKPKKELTEAEKKEAVQKATAAEALVEKLYVKPDQLQLARDFRKSGLATHILDLEPFCVVDVPTVLRALERYKSDGMTEGIIIFSMGVAKIYPKYEDYLRELRDIFGHIDNKKKKKATEAAAAPTAAVPNAPSSAAAGGINDKKVYEFEYDKTLCPYLVFLNNPRFPLQLQRYRAVLESKELAGKFLPKQVMHIAIPEETPEEYTPKRVWLRPVSSDADPNGNRYVQFYHYSDLIPRKWSDLSESEKKEAIHKNEQKLYIADLPPWPEVQTNSKGEPILKRTSWWAPFVKGRSESIKVWGRGRLNGCPYGTYGGNYKFEIDLDDQPLENNWATLTDNERKLLMSLTPEEKLNPRKWGAGDPNKLSNKAMYEFQAYTHQMVDDLRPYFDGLRKKEKKKRSKKKKRADNSSDDDDDGAADPRGPRPRCIDINEETNWAPLLTTGSVKQSSGMEMIPWYKVGELGLYDTPQVERFPDRISFKIPLQRKREKGGRGPGGTREKPKKGNTGERAPAVGLDCVFLDENDQGLDRIKGEFEDGYAVEWMAEIRGIYYDVTGQFAWTVAYCIIKRLDKRARETRSNAKDKILPSMAPMIYTTSLMAEQQALANAHANINGTLKKEMPTSTVSNAVGMDVGDVSIVRSSTAVAAPVPAASPSAAATVVPSMQMEGPSAVTLAVSDSASAPVSAPASGFGAALAVAHSNLPLNERFKQFTAAIGATSSA